MGNLFSSRPRPRPVVLDPIPAGVPIAEGFAPGANARTQATLEAEASALLARVEAAAGNNSLSLRVSSQRNALAHGTDHKLIAMLSLKAPAAQSEVERPPMDLVACIDRSGSMHGSKMQLMKKTLELLVTRSGLKADDRLALVTFDSGVKLELPLTAMDAAGRSRAEAVVKGVCPGSTTNLSGGALRAIDVLDASATDAKAEKSRTRAVMLFTDGLANEGIREPNALTNAVNGALRTASAKLGGPISLFSFGFGADHNENVLRTLATGSAAGGLYYYIASAESIPDAFADCLGGLTSVVAQNATLSLEPSAGVTVSRVLGSTYARDADGKLQLGDLFAEDEKDVLVELSIPKLQTPAENVTVLRASLRAFNVSRAAPEAVEAALQICRPTVEPADQEVNTELDAQVNRIEVAEAMENASAMADRGDVQKGREVLRAVRSKVATSSSASAQHKLSLNLLQECETLDQHFESTAAYRSVGSKMSKMHARSHQVQRAVHTNVDTYGGGAKRKAAMKMGWSSALKSSAHQDSGSDSD